MITWMLKLWIETNDIAKNNPIFYMVIFVLIFVFYNGLPTLVRWRKSEIKRHEDARENSRKRIIAINDNVQKNSVIIADMKETLDRHNGSLIETTNEFKKHIMDESIHTRAEKFVTRDFYIEQQKNIATNQNQMISEVSRIHDRIDELYAIRRKKKS